MRSYKDAIFIHSCLDDLGLTMPAFRALAHIVSRIGKQHHEWLPKEISAACRMNKDTLAVALKELELFDILRRTRRPGKTTHYEITAPQRWQKRGVIRKEGLTPDSRGGVTPDSSGVLPEKEGGALYKRNRGIINKEDGEFALSSESISTVPKKPKGRDDIFEALAQAQGSDWKNLTKPERAKLNVAAANIKKACPDVTADEIHRRAANYTLLMPWAQLTANALAAHWSRTDHAISTPSLNQKPKF